MAGTPFFDLERRRGTRPAREGPRRLLSRSSRTQLARAPRAARHAAVQLRVKDAPPTGSAREDRGRHGGCLAPCLPAHRQRLLARGARRRAPTTCIWARRTWPGADVAALHAKGVRLGISTHSHEELAVALAAQPDYVALGPIYETKLKVMKWAPQGLDRIADWQRRIGDLPLVAIGGLTPERADAVLAAGADSVAVITDFFTPPDPAGRARWAMAWLGTGVQA